MDQNAAQGFFELTHRFDEALVYASDAHRHQARKGTAVPYVAHCMAAASLVLENGGGEDQAIAALLHDVVEDCGVEHEVEIRARFGAPVADMVLACSDATPQAGEAKPPWMTRKQGYLEHLRSLEVDEPVLLVTVCDKLHNLRSIESDLEVHGPAVWERFNADLDDQRWYYTELADVLAARSTSQAAREVARIVARLFPPDQSVGAVASD